MFPRYVRKSYRTAKPFSLGLELLEDRSVPAATSFGGGVLTIDFNAVNEIINVTTSGADIVLTGSTFTGAGATFLTANVSKITFSDSGANEAGQSITFANALTLSQGLSGTGVETVFFDAAITAGSTAAISVVAGQRVEVFADVTGGSGGVTLVGQGTASLDTIGVLIAATVTTVNNGAVVVTGFGGSGSGGDNYGVLVDAGQITSGGTGTVAVTGTGGSGTGSDNYGVALFNAGQISSGGAGTVSVFGTGGSGSNGDNYGVWVVNTGSTITSGGGTVEVSGQGGGGTGSGNTNYGVVIEDGRITAGGAGNVSVSGTGGTGSGSDNYGVWLATADAEITSNSGNVEVVGQGGGSGAGGFNFGVVVDFGQITSGGGTVIVDGTGGSGTGATNIGVLVASGTVTSGGGNVDVTGKGGNSLGFSPGILVEFGAVIAAAGATSTVTVTGTGGTGTINNDGVRVTGSTITSAGGNVSVTGTGGLGTNQNFGVQVNGAGTITAGGSGTVTVEGTGKGTGAFNDGVFVQAGATITSSDGDVEVTGTGGAGTNSNFGVRVLGGGTTITAGGMGNVTVTGTGGAGSGTNNFGVLVSGTNSKITSGGGAITVTATGNTNTNPAEALRLESSGSIVSGGNAAITINADSVNLLAGTTINSGTGVTTVRNRTAGTQIDLGGADVLTGSPLTLGLTTAELNQITAGTLVVGSATAGPITVTAAIAPTGTSNLTLITDGQLLDGNGTGNDLTVANLGIVAPDGIGTIGNPLELAVGTLTTDSTGGTGDQFLSEADNLTVAAGDLASNGIITLTGGTFLTAVGGNIVGPVVVASGATLGGVGSTGDATVQSGGTLAPGNSPGIISTGDLTLAAGSTFAVEVNGATPGTQHDQTVVTGTVDVTDAILSPTGTIPSNPGQEIVLIANDGADLIVGTFAGLIEGATVTINSLTFVISYEGGDGNDVALTQAEAGSLVVTTIDDVVDALDGVTSLREAIAFANSNTGADTVTFDATVFATAQTITLGGTQLTLTDTTGTTTITGPSAGLTVDGNGTSRVFAVAAGASGDIAGLNITGGNASYGGGVRNDGSLVMSNCTISANSIPSQEGGGVYNGSAGNLTLTNCTIAGNTALFGGGLFNLGTASLTNCTISGNTASNFGGGVFNNGVATLTMVNTILAGNSAPSDRDIIGVLDGSSQFNLFGTGGSGGLVNGVNGNIVGVSNPLLSSLGNFGGSVPTIALLPGSPAINAGTSTGAPTTDSRGSGLVGVRDIGAFESQGFTLAVVSGNNQFAAPSNAFANSLVVSVTANNAIEPVIGGQVTFTAPGSGASFTPTPITATIGSDSKASSGTITANASLGAYTATASATGAIDVSFTLTNTDSVILGTLAPSSVVINTAYTGTIAVTGGQPGYTLGTVTGLPAGLSASLTGSTITISGTPTALGSASISVTVTDSINQSTTQSFTLDVVEAGSLVVTTLADVVDPLDGLNSLREAVAFAGSVAATNPTVTFAVSGTIVLGGTQIALTAATGTLTIDGDGRIILDGDDASRILSVSGGSGLVLDGLTFTRGDAGASSGGALTYSGSLLRIIDSSFIENNATSAGAINASQTNNATFTIAGSRFLRNTATNSGAINAIQNDDGLFSITDSEFAGNIATSVTGALNLIQGDRATTEIVRSLFDANEADVVSGINLIQALDSAFDVTSSTFANHTAATNGGVINYLRNTGSVGTVRGSTFVDNSAPIAAVFSGPAPLQVQGSLFARNRTTTAIISLGNNLLDDAAAGTGFTEPTDLVDVAPLLAPLGNYGGPTRTFALLPGSPAIDVGAGTAVDQRGVATVGTRDIGAFESRGFTLAIVGGNNQIVSAGGAYPVPLTVSVTSAFGEPVTGGVVTFTAPLTGASTVPVSGTASIDGTGLASVSRTSNGTVGTFAVAATTPGATAANFSLTAGTSPTIAPPTIPPGTTGTPSTIAISTTGFPAPTFTATGLPPGLVIDPATGTISGTPTQAGDFQVVVTATNGLGSASTTFTIPIAATVVRFPAFSVGSGSGIPAEIQLYSSDGTLAQTLRPFGDFSGGVAVATGDLDGDGVNDTVAGAGAGGGPRVVVLSGATGEVLSDFFAYESSFRGGVWVAVGDLDGDGTNEIVVGAGVGGGPRVRAVKLDGAVVADFFTADSDLRFGVTVAVDDLTGDGIDDIVTGAGREISIFAGGDFSLFSQFDTGLAAPISVAVAGGTIYAGSGFGDSAQIRTFSANGETVSTQSVFEDAFTGGARIAATDLDSDGIVELVVGAGVGGGPRVEVLGTELDFFAFDPALRGGVFVG